MHAITLKQPWAYAVCHLGKQIENRTRKPPAKLIGQRVAIHAGAAWDDGGWNLLDPVYGVPAADELPRGAVIATARLVGFVEAKRESLTGESVVVFEVTQPGAREIFDTWTQQNHRWWLCGPVGHVLSDVRVLDEPVPCRGNLGYWRLPANVEAAVLQQEAA